MEGAHLPGPREKDNKTYTERDVKMPCKGVSLSLGTLLGHLEGFRLQGLYEKNDSIFGFLC